MVSQARLSIASNPAELATARRFTESRLAEWGIGSVSEAVVLVVSELATNAMIHGHAKAELRLILDGSVLRVEVRDSSTTVPQVKEYSETATTGRGMVIVQALSSSWGANVGAGGKVVWCELDTGHAREPSQSKASAGQPPQDTEYLDAAAAQPAIDESSDWNLPRDLTRAGRRWQT
jgi:anti-sigma regulatory factor (Ser/Thr protein kinase)